jgi:hypothetical protein
MTSRNIHYLQELKEQFYQKIFDDWDTKWTHFPWVEGDDFSALPSLNAFVEELHEDIDDTLRLKLPSKERLEMMISKENLRRILKNNHEIRLQSHTRNCLAYYLGFDGWEDFKEQTKLNFTQESIQVNYVQVYQSLLPKRQVSNFQLPPDTDYVILSDEPFWKTKLFKQVVGGILLFSLLTLAGFTSYRWYKNRPFTPEQLAKVKFEIIEDYAKPNNNHLKIKYDVSSLSCDSVVIDFDSDQVYMVDFQQYGSTYQEIVRNKIDTISHTYHIPDIFEIKLIVNNQVVKALKKIVYSGNEWVAFANGSFQLKPWIGHIKKTEEIIHDSVLHFHPNLVDRPNANMNYWVQCKMLKDFGIDADSVTFETRFRNAYQDGGISCYDSPITITTDKKKIIGGNFIQDCIEYASVIVGKMEWRGSTHNLSFMDLNLQEWQVFKVIIKNHVAVFYVNDKEVFKTKCEDNLGLIKGISYNFKGSGSVDWVKLSNSYTGKLVFYDDFVR